MSTKAGIIVHTVKVISGTGDRVDSDYYSFKSITVAVAEGALDYKTIFKEVSNKGI